MKKYIIRFAGWLKRRLEKFLQSENQRQFRIVDRQIQERLAANKKYVQDICPHVAGCSALSEQQDTWGRTSIVWHTLNTKEEIGLCTNCHREFRSTDADFVLWREKPSFNRASSACSIPNPNGVKLNEEHKQDTRTFEQEELWAISQAYKDAGPFGHPAQELDALSDKEIKNLFEGVRAERQQARKEANNVQSA